MLIEGNYKLYLYMYALIWSFLSDLKYLIKTRVHGMAC